mmetsp:Transcript_1805/g.3883  ORF Transcript_1805/g.3883 Transcript_1805/m.3883 type:complete len:225 (+) Transcript_1805:99-773(+)|eukprot:CAMPEP_0201118186 /NCGR_PEP_ID=MMETSP0850-20130426/2301_1 /ASSEMBLY_ACC=CAM_ASM_000622 /TAXON_ID=183588 /ORGANISM="Pseudo-nitzschia fraudulenta, Strain WWA7" /LENGTH=224 /DNA_ID=CAMNT_0047383179 /DNA_START=25 /DNA_END=699 /DNA_ORIENTATION=+
MTTIHVTKTLLLAVLVIVQSVLVSVEAFGMHNHGLRRSVASHWDISNRKNKSEATLTLEGHRRLLDEDATMPCRTSSTASSKMGDRSNEQWSRNQFLKNCRSCLTYGLAASTAASLSGFPRAANAKSYSENAKNLERINNGDFSGGAVFNNNPTTERGQKRRAMTGCKVTMAREEASNTILKRQTMISEKECNTMVMDGETEFMLQALRNLDCPTCANGIGKSD